MNQYSVTGMSCAACSARVEKTVSNLEGVSSCSVNLLTNSMEVEGTATPQTVIKAVKKAGYGAALMNNSAQKEESLPKNDTVRILGRLVASVIFLLPLMYISMGSMMWGWPLPQFLVDNHMAQGIIQLVLSVIIMVINQKFFISGFKGIIKLAPNMDTLVALGSGASFIYSVVILFSHHETGHLYFESVAMILTLITVGKMLESYSKGKTTNAIKGLMELAPKTARVLVDGEEKNVQVDTLKIGDIYIVKAGETIPVDGEIIEGACSVNEATLTGESIPVDKQMGLDVFGATILTSGYIKCKATRVGEDTTLAKIVKLVNDASASKAPIAKVADKVSGFFVPVVMGIAVVTFVVWMLCGAEFDFAFSRGISVLVISCPCALGLATPVAIMVGNGVAAKRGVLFKTAQAIENTGRTTIVALDKTGTITKGMPEVTDVIGLKADEKEILSLAYALESKSEHPIAKAIVEKAKTDSVDYEITDYETLPGNGIKAIVNGREIYVGNLGEIPPTVIDEYNRLADEGKTPVFVIEKDEVLGIIAVADVMKEDSVAAIKQLREMGIRTVMLTGDNERTANAIGRLCGVDEVIAGVLPEGKAEHIKALKNKGRVAMVGDGINDAPALTVADTGIAIGNGTDIAMDSADIVLMKNSFMGVAKAIYISRKTLKNIKENLFWAFIYNMIGIPLAAGVFYVALGWELNPMFGAAAMSLSSFCVVMNALRLNLMKK